MEQYPPGGLVERYKCPNCPSSYSCKNNMMQHLKFYCDKPSKKKEGKRPKPKARTPEKSPDKTTREVKRRKLATSPNQQVVESHKAETSRVLKRIEKKMDDIRKAQSSKQSDSQKFEEQEKKPKMPEEAPKPRIEDPSDEPMLEKELEDFKCQFCSKAFHNRELLKRHSKYECVDEDHVEKIAPSLEPPRYEPTPIRETVQKPAAAPAEEPQRESISMTRKELTIFKCNSCSKTFSKKMLLIRHKQVGCQPKARDLESSSTEKDSIVYKCQFCSKSFYKKLCFTRHAKYCGDQSQDTTLKIPCQETNPGAEKEPTPKGPTKFEFDSNKQSQKPEEPAAIKEATHKPSATKPDPKVDEQAVSMVQKSSSEGEVLKCKFCSKSFSTHELLKRHAHFECSMNQQLKKDLPAHESSAVKDVIIQLNSDTESGQSSVQKSPELLKCQFCSKTFNKKEVLKRHTKYECGLNQKKEELTQYDPTPLKGAQKSEASGASMAQTTTVLPDTGSNKKEPLKKHNKYECNQDQQPSHGSPHLEIPAYEPTPLKDIAQKPIEPQPKTLQPTLSTTEKESEIFKCQFCSKTFEKRDFLKRHNRYECTGHQSKIDTHTEHPEADIIKKPASVSQSTEPEVFKCQFCSKSFHKKELLRRHTRYECDLRQPKMETPTVGIESSNKAAPIQEANVAGAQQSAKEKVAEVFKCQFCAKSFHKKELLRRHTRYECDLSQKSKEETPAVDVPAYEPTALKELPPKPVPTEESEKSREPATENEPDIFKCQFCSKTFQKRELLKRHTKYECLEQPQKVETYPEVPAYQPTPLKDISQKPTVTAVPTQEAAIEKEPEVFKCQYCSKTFNKKEFLKRHTRYECSLDQRAKTDDPSKPSDEPETSTTQKAPENEPDQFKCRFCSKTFPKKDLLRVHKRYECNLKPKKPTQFPEPPAYEPTPLKEIPPKHPIPSTEPTVFPCTFCHKKFPKKELLKRHTRYECGLDATRSKVPQDPTDQESSNSPDPDDSNNSCPLCSKVFEDKDLLKRHTRYECGVEPHSKDGTSCPHCPFKAADKQALKSHIGIKHYVPW